MSAPDYQILNGIKCYAPALAKENSGFPPDKFRLLHDAEKNNFWFRTRNSLLQYLFRKHTGVTAPKNILEVGCGTGYVLNGLSHFQNFRLTGSEIYLEGLAFARQRLPEVNFIQMDATHMPFRNEFDAVGAFDVLEHIDDDDAVIRNIHTALKPGGLFYITVPQHMFLWSYLDEIACHRRRYMSTVLQEKLKSAGFTIVQKTSFVFTLFPFMILSRLFKKQRANSQANDKKVFSELHLPLLLNQLFRMLAMIDVALIKMGFSLPCGGSLVIVAEKQPV